MSPVEDFKAWLLSGISKPYIAASVGEKGDPDFARWPKEALETPWLWMKTSGTTATDLSHARWVAHTRQSLIASAEAVCDRLEVQPSDRWGRVLTRSHMGGLSLDVRSVCKGFEVVEADFSRDFSWNVLKFCEWIDQKKISIVSLVPTQVFDLCRLKRSPPPSLRLVVVGGDRLADSIYQEAIDLGWPLLRSYGLTETASMVACEARVSSRNLKQNLEQNFPSGKLKALKHADFRIEPSGLLSIKSSSLFCAELKIRNENTELVYRTGDWWTTSDRGAVTAEGLEISGRSDDYVKVLGSFVNLADLDLKLGKLLGELGWSGGAMFVALPDDRAGHSLTMVVESSGDLAKDQSILTKWNENCVGLERAKALHSVGRLPRNQMGKLQRNLVIAQLATF